MKVYDPPADLRLAAQDEELVNSTSSNRIYKLENGGLTAWFLHTDTCLVLDIGRHDLWKLANILQMLEIKFQAQRGGS